MAEKLGDRADIDAARLFNLMAARLGLAVWKASVEEKLTTLNDIYRFAVFSFSSSCCSSWAS